MSSILDCTFHLYFSASCTSHSRHIWVLFTSVKFLVLPLSLPSLTSPTHLLILEQMPFSQVLPLVIQQKVVMLLLSLNIPSSFRLIPRVAIYQVCTLCHILCQALTYSTLLKDAHPYVVSNNRAGVNPSCHLCYFRITQNNTQHAGDHQWASVEWMKESINEGMQLFLN